VIFDGTGDDRSVDSMEPTPGTTVHAGITVKLHVPGAPPDLTVPRLIGMACAKAGREAADQGLNPQYMPKKTGSVLRQDPEPSTTARWTDTITLYCSDGPGTPSTF
jgi:beta-lactam-binding protein with PASTA domain